MADRRREAKQRLLNGAATMPTNAEKENQQPFDMTLATKHLLRVLDDGPGAAGTKKKTTVAVPATTSERDDLLRMVEDRMGACALQGTAAAKPNVIAAISESDELLRMAEARLAERNGSRGHGTRKATTAYAEPATTKAQQTQKTQQRHHPIATTTSATYATSGAVRSAGPPTKSTNTSRPASSQSAASNRVTPPRVRINSASGSAPIPIVPRVYNYKAIYDQKKQKAAAQLREEERKAREIVARPMPDFSSAHRQLDMARRASAQPITCPKTPKTLRMSNAALERQRRQREENARQQLAEHQTIRARPASVLAAEPFRPQIQHREIEAQPFRMVGQERTAEMREARERRNEELERRQREEQLEREERERRVREEHRKNTVFKAQPNPFA